MVVVGGGVTPPSCSVTVFLNILLPHPSQYTRAWDKSCAPVSSSLLLQVRSTLLPQASGVLYFYCSNEETRAGESEVALRSAHLGWGGVYCVPAVCQALGTDAGKMTTAPCGSSVLGGEIGDAHKESAWEPHDGLRGECPCRHMHRRQTGSSSSRY